MKYDKSFATFFRSYIHEKSPLYTYGGDAIMPTIRIIDHGPYQVSGTFEIVDAEGNTFETKGDVSLCRCGRSENKPFCDSTHEEIDFNSKPRADKQLVEV